MTCTHGISCNAAVELGLENRRAVLSSDVVKRTSSCVMYFQRRTAEQQRTFLFGIAFQNRHHEDKAVQVFQRQHSLQLDVQGGTAWESALFLKSRPGKAARYARTGLNRLERVLYDRAFCPIASPIPKHPVPATA